MEAIEAELIPGGMVANRKYLASWLEGEAATDPRSELLYDPQTSGGLLIAVPGSEAEHLERALKARDVPVHPVGRVVEGRPGTITLL
jgi:selenide,water dikinase